MKKKNYLIILFLVTIIRTTLSQEVYPDPQNSPNKNFPSKQLENGNVLLRETFRDSNWKYAWRNTTEYISTIKTISDQEYGEVLFIEKSDTLGNSFLEKDINPKILRGRDIMIRGGIKFDNIRRGNVDWKTGKLCLKFKVDEIEYFEAVQHLEGSSDWFTYYAHADDSHEKVLDNTEHGNYVIHIPNNATNIVLYLGLQNCIGNIQFSYVEIVEVK